jgi:hypothetical protein
MIEEYIFINHFHLNTVTFKRGTLQSLLTFFLLFKQKFKFDISVIQNCGQADLGFLSITNADRLFRW